MAYPVKFRKHLLRVKKEEGLSYAETARRFKIAKVSVVRWEQRIEPMKLQRSGRKINRQMLMADVEKHPFDYQRERAARFEVSQRAIHAALRLLGVTYKKNPLDTRRQTLLPGKLLKKK
jgi:transposase